jgi:hypothetical protein
MYTIRNLLKRKLGFLNSKSKSVHTEHAQYGAEFPCVNQMQFQTLSENERMEIKLLLLQKKRFI